MSWRELLLEAQGPETRVLPWVGRLPKVHAPDRTYRLKGDPPPRAGWWEFRVQGREAELVGPAEPEEDAIPWRAEGYVVGSLLFPDWASTSADTCGARIYGLEDGLERFSRIRAGRVYFQGPWWYVGLALPHEAEDAVREAYWEERTTLESIPGVSPALEVVFHRHTQARRELEEARARETARAEQEAREARQREFRRSLESAEGRRALAATDFGAAARAALAVGRGQYLDHRPGPRGQWFVQYQVAGRRIECVCTSSLSVIDAGICLTDEGTGESGDRELTLESLPAVVQYAIDEDRLYITRRA
jgi:hypothetical protein